MNRKKRARIRHFGVKSGSGTAMCLTAKRWNILKRWVISKDCLPTKQELLDDLLYEPGELFDKVAAIASRHGVAQVIDAAHDFIHTNPQLLRLTTKQISDWYK